MKLVLGYIEKYSICSGSLSPPSSRKLSLVLNFKASHYYFLFSYFPEEIPLLFWLVWRFLCTPGFFSLAFLSSLISFRQG